MAGRACCANKQELEQGLAVELAAQELAQTEWEPAVTKCDAQPELEAGTLVQLGLAVV